MVSNEEIKKKLKAKRGDPDNIVLTGKQANWLSGKLSSEPKKDETIVFFEGGRTLTHSMPLDLEITSGSLIVHKRGIITSKISQTEIYKRNRMANIQFGHTLYQLRFDYEGKNHIYTILPKYMREIEWIISNNIKSKGQLTSYKIELMEAKRIVGYDQDSLTMVELYLGDEGLSIKGKGINHLVRYEEISSIGLGKKLKKVLGLPFKVSNVEILVSGGKIDYYVNSQIGERFVSQVRNKILKVKDTSKEQFTAFESKYDPMEEIKKAKELLDIGAITEEEFARIKEKCLKNYN